MMRSRRRRAAAARRLQIVGAIKVARAPGNVMLFASGDILSDGLTAQEPPCSAQVLPPSPTAFSGRQAKHDEVVQGADTFCCRHQTQTTIPGEQRLGNTVRSTRLSRQESRRIA